jgi:tetratricopeptide (TPR) repeat protein
MYRWHSDSPLKLLRRSLLILVLATFAPGGLSSLQIRGQLKSGPLLRASVASFGTFPILQASSDDKSPGDSDTEWEGVVRVISKENTIVFTAFILMQPYLPLAARVTSGYRDPKAQLEVIRRFAKKNHIPVPENMRVDDPSTWQDVLSKLRALKYTIASPVNPPHSSGEFIVFDLSGANLDQIKAGCSKAAEIGLIELRKPPLVEPKNNAVHVELKVTNKGLMVLGLRQPVAPALSSDSSDSKAPAQSSDSSDSRAPEAAPSPLPEDDQRALLQKLQAQHDANPDPNRQIEYDKQMISLTTDVTARKALSDEIELHKNEARQLAQNKEKEEATRLVSEALQNGRLDEAEIAAQKFTEEFPDDPKAKLALNQVRTELLINQAIDNFLKAECGEYEEAQRKIDEALQLSGKNVRAQRIKAEVDLSVGVCKTRRTGIIILCVLASAGVLIGLYFLLRPKKWVLEGIYGPCKGEIFPLDKQKIRIGAVDSAEEEIDIVISDDKHRISRLHCSMKQDGRHWYLKDKSTNGTKINDMDIEKDGYVKLRNKDEISLADEAGLLFRPK